MSPRKPPARRPAGKASTSVELVLAAIAPVQRAHPPVRAEEHRDLAGARVARPGRRATRTLRTRAGDGAPGPRAPGRPDAHRHDRPRRPAASAPVSAVRRRVPFAVEVEARIVDPVVEHGADGADSSVVTMIARSRIVRSQSSNWPSRRQSSTIVWIIGADLGRRRLEQRAGGRLDGVGDHEDARGCACEGSGPG